jgi:hypothetical protein
MFLTPFDGGAGVRLCGDCQGQPIWSPTGDFVLVAQPSAPGAIALVNRVTGRLSTYMRGPMGAELRARGISVDGKWVAFTLHRGQPGFRRYVAPFAPARAPLPDEWIEVGSSTADHPYSRWSPDGGTLYFGSTRDGFACLWAQRLNRRTMHPEGKPFAIEHFHLPTMALESPSLAYPFALGSDAAIVSITERTGGLWVLDFGAAR